MCYWNVDDIERSVSALVAAGADLQQEAGMSATVSDRLGEGRRWRTSLDRYQIGEDHPLGELAG